MSANVSIWSDPPSPLSANVSIRLHPSPPSHADVIYDSSLKPTHKNSDHELAKTTRMQHFFRGPLNIVTTTLNYI